MIDLLYLCTTILIFTENMVLLWLLLFVHLPCIDVIYLFFPQVTQEISDPSRVFHLLGSDRLVLISDQS